MRKLIHSEWKMNALLSAGRPTPAEVAAYALYLATEPPASKSVLLDMDAPAQVNVDSFGFFGETVFAKSSAQVAIPVAQSVLQESCELKLKQKEDKKPEPTEPKSELLGVRFQMGELSIIRLKAQLVGVSTNSYIRASSLGSDYKAPPSINPEWLAELKASNLELTRQGTNINQIAKLRNGGRISDTEAESMLGIIARSYLQTHKMVRDALSRGHEMPPEP